MWQKYNGYESIKDLLSQDDDVYDRLKTKPLLVKGEFLDPVVAVIYYDVSDKEIMIRNTFDYTEDVQYFMQIPD